MRFSLIFFDRRDERLFVISCVNSISAVEKAVQLWQCSSSKSPANVSFLGYQFIKKREVFEPSVVE